ncbi:MAG: hypothetical protein K6F48_11030 [Paludibacteraceae bacterium]|nr:hypothetical protein [Paludibacteraceae bacterium]
MDSSDFIYILLVVGIFVYSIMKSKIKAAENREESKAKSQTISSGVEPMTTPFKERIASDKKRSSSPFLTTEMETYDSAKNVRKQKTQPQKNVRKDASSSMAGADMDCSDGFSFKTAEDAKRAFIASEIWNRKY